MTALRPRSILQNAETKAPRGLSYGAWANKEGYEAGSASNWLCDLHVRPVLKSSTPFFKGCRTCRSCEHENAEKTSSIASQTPVAWLCWLQQPRIWAKMPFYPLPKMQFPPKGFWRKSKRGPMTVISLDFPYFVLSHPSPLFCCCRFAGIFPWRNKLDDWLKFLLTANY